MSRLECVVYRLNGLFCDCLIYAAKFLGVCIFLCMKCCRFVLVIYVNEKKYFYVFSGLLSGGGYVSLRKTTQPFAL